MKIYRVGGAVRDPLLGLPVNDIDWVVVGATAQQMLDKGFQQVGRDFPVFLHPKSKQEYALARTERKTAPGYTGFIVHADADVSLEQDLARRDLTINAMAQDDVGNIVDPYNGQQDLEKKILRHVTNAFTEDPLRVLRVARFAARFFPLGFSLAPETLVLMRQIVAAGELETLVAERVWTETDRALAETDPLAYFDVLDDCAALQRVFPEVAAVWRQDPETNLGPSPAPNARQLLGALMKIDAPFCSAELRFAALTMNIKADALSALVSRLRVPKSYHQLAQLAQRSIERMHGFNTMNAEQRLQLLESMDVLRRPQRIGPLLQLARCHWQLQDDSADDYIQARLFTQAMAAISSVSSRDLLDQGIKGPAIAEALREKRLAVLAT
ncbi:MAG: multifunctional CCA tRNA nucleotidyl transferase/2'3'-cyclic phosphodiesterase/2'nucleotidase/phosphatase [Gammaproteobacteria bacterium]|nr:multifunctional CCA tRNA nucleotidyl transferase/2'3'-cyclic phosphodiesterase/2'nucleotidase/phosphatase [Gammaproteobacteria bacterium]